MITTFKNKKITGVLSVLPENEYLFDDEILEAEDLKAKRLKRIMGYGKRRRVKKDTTMSEMMEYGIKYLINSGKLKKEEIGALVVVTLSSDYFIPQISSIIHGNLELPVDVQCFDIPQACAGYIVGLMQSFMLLEHIENRKVILCTGEIFNRKTKENEPKYSYPPFGGDIANITVIENCKEEQEIYYNFYADGKKRDCLVIHDGGFKNPMTVEKINMQMSRLPFMGVDMNGSAVFNFVQKEVPPLIDEIVEKANYKIDDLDWFFFHQPNKFMLQKLAEKLNIPYSKMPMNIVEKFGNSNSGTIPIAMTENAAKELMEKDNLCCLSGFGAGLTWASIIMRIGKLDFCENIISNL